MITPRVDVEVLRVFCDAEGGHGNRLGVVRDGAAMRDTTARQDLARRLGFSETVFVDDPARGVVDIYTPGARLPFAGHPLVGIAWLLGLEELDLPVGRVVARRDGDTAWITARAAWAPPRTLRRHGSVDEVDALAVPPPGEWIYAWAWQDEAAGLVRARAFPGRGDGIDEDEATGAAALLLTAELGSALTITQGRGSRILTAPVSDTTVSIGGRVRHEATWRR